MSARAPSRPAAPCPACGAALETPVACGACGAVLEVAAETSPFALFGFEPRWDVDEREVRLRLTRFARLVHPDYFAAAGQGERERAARASALLNGAFATLTDDGLRGDWLVASLGGPREDEERAMPAAFLGAVLEWNELLDEAEAGRASTAQVAELVREIAVRRTAALSEVRQALEPLPAPGAPALRAARRALNALRYLERAEERIEALRLARAERR